jgi:hypothetical protein
MKFTITSTPAEPYDVLYKSVQHPAIEDPSDWKLKWSLPKGPDYGASTALTISRRIIPRGRTMYEPDKRQERYIGRAHYRYYRARHGVMRQGERFNFGLHRYEV